MLFTDNFQYTELHMYTNWKPEYILTSVSNHIISSKSNKLMKVLILPSSISKLNIFGFTLALSWMNCVTGDCKASVLILQRQEETVVLTGKRKCKGEARTQLKFHGRKRVRKRGQPGLQK